MQIIERLAIGANNNLQKFKWPLLTFDPAVPCAPECNTNQIVSNVLLLNVANCYNIQSDEMMEEAV